MPDYFVPAGHHYGLTLANDPINPANGYVMGSGEGASLGVTPALISLALPTAKRFDAPWQSGAGEGGRFTASYGDGFYYAWLIENPDSGVVDWGFSESKIDPTGEPNYPFGFSMYHYCGAVLRENGAFVALQQSGNRFVRQGASANDGAAVPCSLATASAILTAPPGTVALVRARLSNGNTTTNLVFGDGGMLLSLNAAEASLSAAGGQADAGHFMLRTDVFRRIAHRATSVAGSPTFSLRTYGWIDDAIGSAGSPLSSTTLRAVACAIRYTGSAWEFISDANHQPVGVTSISRVAVSGGFALRITYDFTASKVAALLCGPDETFAGVYHVGASVGLTFSDVYIRDGSGTLVDPNTVTVGGNFWVMGTMIS